MLVKALSKWHKRLYLLLIISVLSSALLIGDGELMGLRLVHDIEHGNKGFFAAIALFNIIIAYLVSLAYIKFKGEPFFNLRRVLSYFGVPFLTHPLTILFFVVCGIWIYMALKSVYPFMQVLLAIVLLILQFSGTITVFILLKWISQKFKWVSQFVHKYNYGVMLTVLLSLSSAFYDYSFIAAASFNFSPFIGLPYEIFILRGF